MFVIGVTEERVASDCKFVCFECPDIVVVGNWVRLNKIINNISRLARVGSILSLQLGRISLLRALDDVGPSCRHLHRLENSH